MPRSAISSGAYSVSGMERGVAKAIKHARTRKEQGPSNAPETRNRRLEDESSALKPVTARTFPLDAIVDAHWYMKSNQQVVKIMVTVNTLRA